MSKACRSRVAYLNLYASGYYHSAGKPNQFNAHPGDLYPTRAHAEADIGNHDLYLGTVAVLLPAPVVGLIGEVNPADSQPIPISTTREVLQDYGAGAMKAYVGL